MRWLVADVDHEFHPKMGKYHLDGLCGNRSTRVSFDRRLDG